ncbi:hypothetical protein YC2023_118003 [Brassica napus]
MIQSPKLVKPVLHLPQLEANRFNQLQTRHWRPEDHLNQSGDILGVHKPTLMSNSSFLFRSGTRSEPIKHPGRSQGSSIIHKNRLGSRRIKFLTWSQNPIKGSNG